VLNIQADISQRMIRVDCVVQMGEVGDPYMILVAKHESKKPCSIPRHTDGSVILQFILRKGMDCICLAQDSIQ
jgi:hypothetical protein